MPHTLHYLCKSQVLLNFIVANVMVSYAINILIIAEDSLYMQLVLVLVLVSLKQLIPIWTKVLMGIFLNKVVDILDCMVLGDGESSAPSFVIFSDLFVLIGAGL